MIEKIFKTLEIAIMIIASLCAFTILGVALFTGNFHPAMIVFLIIGIATLFMAFYSYEEQKEEEKK